MYSVVGLSGWNNTTKQSFLMDLLTTLPDYAYVRFRTEKKTNARTKRNLTVESFQLELYNHIHTLLYFFDKSYLTLILDHLSLLSLSSV